MTRRRHFGYGGYGLPALTNSTWDHYDPQYGGGGWGAVQAPLIADYNGGYGTRVIDIGPGATTTALPQETPLVATVLPSGQVVISHAGPETGAPVYSATGATVANATHAVTDFWDGKTFGIDNKLLLLGGLALFFFKK